MIVQYARNCWLSLSRVGGFELCQLQSSGGLRCRRTTGPAEHAAAIRGQ